MAFLAFMVICYLTINVDAVIDMRATVKVIAPKCSRDPRPSVLQEYCTLLGLIPSFRNILITTEGRLYFFSKYIYIKVSIKYISF